MNVTPASRETVVDSHPADGLMRADRLPHILCPGCGIGSIAHCYIDAVARSGIGEDRHVCVSGIGCSGRAAGYVNVDSYHTTHGRAIPFAMGIAVQNPSLVVTVISGDGDLTSIGGNHFIHAARRNVALNVICINNFNYGMTGGQAGPTTPRSAKSSTTPFGCWERPFNLPHLAEAVGASFVARWTTLHVRQLQDAILYSMNKTGFRFIEVLSPCPTGFGRPNDIGDGLTEMQNYMRRCVVDEDADLRDTEIDLTHPDSRIVVGNFVDLDCPSFHPALTEPPPPPRSAAAWAAVRPTQFRAS
ncbi:MAG: thiamine pyrophosphate-dependent enzyme [Verrucomicrobia bacterium]|nr:thiamine pyrophosphate-dependent enzyme [Verrucomicrobiota bacterium]MDA1086235.1 thiamine pyrophosphate-dependent enzyme [Verrucomicrobiota bacterium]